MQTKFEDYRLELEHLATLHEIQELNRQRRLRRRKRFIALWRWRLRAFGRLVLFAAFIFAVEYLILVFGLSFFR